MRKIADITPRVDEARQPSPREIIKEDWEREREGSKVVSFSFLKENYSELAGWVAVWLTSRMSESAIDDYCVILDLSKTEMHGVSVNLFTEENAYWIVAVSPNREDPDGYLGCQVSSRTPQVGELHDRGADLSDGEYSQDTWNQIVEDIARYELLPLELD